MSKNRKGAGGGRKSLRGGCRKKKIWVEGGDRKETGGKKRERDEPCRASGKKAIKMARRKQKSTNWSLNDKGGPYTHTNPRDGKRLEELKNPKKKVEKPGSFHRKGEKKILEGGGNRSCPPEKRGEKKKG